MRCITVIAAFKNGERTQKQRGNNAESPNFLYLYSVIKLIKNLLTMARIKSNSPGVLSGLIGGIVVVQSGEKTIVRSKPDFSKTKWSEKQVMVRERFRKVNDFCARFKNSLIIPIWNLSIDRGSGYHKFLKSNINAFDSSGEIADLSMLHFSDGKLVLPFELRVSIEGQKPGELRVSWQNQEDLAEVSLDDELMMMIAGQNGFEGPLSTGLTRAIGQGTIILPVNAGKILAVYLLFASPQRRSYSPDKYFCLIG